MPYSRSFSKAPLRSQVTEKPLHDDSLEPTPADSDARGFGPLDRATPSLCTLAFGHRDAHWV